VRNVLLVVSAWYRVVVCSVTILCLTPALAAPSAETKSLLAGRLIGWGTRTLPFIEPGTRFTAIAGGESHTLALRADGRIVEWGFATDQRSSDSKIADVTDAIAVGAGMGYSAVLRGDGRVSVWNTSFTDVDEVPPAATNVVAISTGTQHILALRADGTVVGWGNGADARLGFPEGLSNVISVAAGGRHSLIAFRDGTVGAWGYNLSGQLNVPPDLPPVASVAAGYRHSIAMLENGGVRSWRSFGGALWQTNIQAVAGGFDVSYVLTASGEVIGSFGSGLPGPITRVAALASGSNPEFGIDVDGGIACWGNDRDGVNEFRLATNRFVSIKTFVADGECHALALTEAGKVTGWYIGPLFRHRTPTNLTGVIAVAPGWNYGLALKSNGTVISWTLRPSDPDYPVPEGIGDVVAIAAGGDHRLALKSDGSVVGWGRPGDLATTPPRGLSNVVAIAASTFQSVALQADGTVVEWRSQRSFSQARPPADLTDVVAIAAAPDHTLALRSDGRVVGWGDSSARPLRIPEDLTNLVAIATGKTHALGLRPDGSVVRWGDRPGSLFVEIPSNIRDIVAIAPGSTLDCYAIRALPGRLEAVVREKPQLKFQTFAGRDYVIEATDSLSDAAWVPLNAEPWPGNGKLQRMGDTSPVAKARFYRLLESPSPP
jgi:alpha-tubulin suppressor-like RCC1 family protein